MTAAAVNRLINAPTSVWTAHQDNNPNWAFEIAQCLRTKTVSPLAITTNLRKLSDCLAHPEIQPILCQWFASTFTPSEGRGHDVFERVQESVAKCVRTLQMQAISQGRSVNILPKIEELVQMTGQPFENRAALCAAWLPKRNDVYTQSGRSDNYFVNGACIGGEAELKALASRYKQCIAQTMLDHTARKELQNELYTNKPLHFAGHCTPTAHVLLWASPKLDNATKYALAYDWANHAGWNTKEADEKLASQKARYWNEWANHAKVYLNLAGEEHTALNDVKWALKDCPPMIPTKKMDNIDNGLFESASFVVE